MHRRSREQVRSQGINDAFKVIYYFQALVKESWGKDKVFQQFHHDWTKFYENNEDSLDEYQTVQMQDLIQWYTDGLPEDAFTRLGLEINMEKIDENQPIEDVDRLHTRYARLLRDLENIQ